MATASLLVTAMTSSSSEALSTLGTNPAPMPWICGGKQGAAEVSEGQR